MSKFTTFANDCLDMELGGWAAGGYTAGTTSIVRIGGTSYTYPLKLELTSTVSTAGTPGTVVSGGSYPSGGVDLSSGPKVATTGAASASKASSADISITNMPAVTWADVYTHDSTATPKPMLFRGGSSLAKTVNAGDTALILTGNLTATEG
jgi:hypothetical protein